MYNLKILREQAGFNMREVARQLNIPYTTYVGYEKGDREPNSETLIKIAEFYDTTVDYIWEYHDHIKLFMKTLVAKQIYLNKFKKITAHPQKKLFQYIFNLTQKIKLKFGAK